MNESLSILIIEDDADTLTNLCDILELDGHHVVGACSLAEAKAWADRDAFQIVISDRKLPDGLIEDLLPELIDSVKGSDIIVITGFADMQSTITAFRLGVTDYVIKPIIPDDLRSTVRRIADKKRLEAELAKEHAFAELVLDTAEAIVLVLDLEGTVIQLNPYLEQLTGWTPGDLKGKNWFEVCITEEDRERVKEVFIRTAHDVHTRGVVNSVVGKDGRLYQVRWSNTTLKNHNGEVTSVLAVGVDISDLTAAQTRALQSERLAAIGQTMTALAHESRNALQRIQAASELLGLEIAGNEHALHDLKKIQRATDDLKCLLEEVRSFAAPIQMRPTTVGLPEIWRRVWDDLAVSHAQRDVQLIENFESCNIKVDVDTLRMEQVFRNLFENALAACHDPVRIELNCVCDRDHVKLTVLDNGPGMSEEQLEKLFEPFFTTKQSGTGLGLSICQRIIEAHRGSIAARTHPNGAAFEIRLPRQKSCDVEIYP
ncbi:ATP-binding protein [Planctomycetes bacterium TBK1r]|uniref:histidine kinase n=1 Tax=Stieleria magnilauensis TaxID=2527963 RepID=A0ABX5XVL6_9BACT|nr:Sporulation kinase A [Planctomycetes bacterium TBK1r]